MSLGMPAGTALRRGRDTGVDSVFGRHHVPAGKARVVDGCGPSVRRRSLFRRLAGLTAVLLGVPVLTLGLTGATAAASGAGQVTMFPDISQPGRDHGRARRGPVVHQ